MKRPLGRRRGLLEVLQEQDANWLEQQQSDRDNETKREHQELKAKVHQKVVETLKQTRSEDANPNATRAQIRKLVPQILDQMEAGITSIPQIEDIIQHVINEVTGFGPLEELLKDPTVTEIMVNNHKTVFVERDGKVQRANIEFSDDEHVRHVIERIVAPLGRRIDESSPMVDARLPDGSRVNAAIPPLAIDGPNITIRKFPEERLSGDDLISFGSATPEMLDFLAACIKARRSIVISGGTGSGKTTLLNILSNFIPIGERLITIEDAAELRLAHMDHGNIVRFESRPPNIEGKGEISIRKLLKNSLRMRPDRIIVGECRGEEAVDMLQAMNTGHEGSMTTIHANNPRDAIARLEVLVLQGAPELPHAVVRRNIASAVDLIVQQTRLQDGSRKITSIAEVTGVSQPRRGELRVNLRELFRFEQTAVDENGKVIGRFVATGHKPSFLNEMRAKGIHVDETIFERSEGDFNSEGGVKE